MESKRAWGPLAVVPGRARRPGLSVHLFEVVVEQAEDLALHLDEGAVHDHVQVARTGMGTSSSRLMWPGRAPMT